MPNNIPHTVSQGLPSLNASGINMRATRPWAALGFSSVALAVLFLLELGLGSVSIPVHAILSILLGGEAAQPAWSPILLEIRLPRALTAMMGGACLALSGLQMQTLFRNPLAGPYVLGISSGATLGAALAVLGGVGGTSLFRPGGLWQEFGLTLASILGAGMVLALVLAVAQRVRESVTLLILGLMFGHACGALTSVLVYFAEAERIKAFTLWTFGSFAGVAWDRMGIFALVSALGLILATAACKSLNALLLGESYARSLGVDVGKARLLILAGASVLAGTVTAFCGPIAFLGLAVPHLARALFRTADHMVLVPGTVLLGAALALAADIVAGLPGSDSTLPLNSVTALLGAPVVIWIVLRRRNPHRHERTPETP